MIFLFEIKVVLMFWASWNEPCRVMMRPFRAMAVAKRRAAIFCQVDVDKFKVGQRALKKYKSVNIFPYRGCN